MMSVQSITARIINLTKKIYYDRFASLKTLTDKDREEIFKFAMKRSKQIVDSALGKGKINGKKT